MRLKWINTNKDGSAGLRMDEEDIVTFYSTQPVVIQPSEIQKVKVEVHLEVEPGYVLNISTYPKLYGQAGEIFPALITVDHTHKGELMIPVRNNGRNPLNLMVTTPIAQAYVTRVERLTLEEGVLIEPPKAKMPKTRPQKKNTGPKFEIK